MAVITIIEGQDAISSEKKLVSISTPRPDAIEKTSLEIMRKIETQMMADIAARNAALADYRAKIAAVEAAFQ